MQSSIQTHKASEKGASVNNGRILIVDDDRTLRAIMAMQLEDMDYDIVEVTNGHEAFELLKTSYSQIDIILLDREMPVMDGMQLIQKLKSHAQTKNIPVVMVTGSGQPQEISEGIASGVFYYLIKPIHYNVLTSVIASAMADSKRNTMLSHYLEKDKAIFPLLVQAEFSIKTVVQALHISQMLALCFPDPERVISGVSALLLNAIEHGNLAIGFKEKEKLLQEKALDSEITARQEKPEYRDRRVSIIYKKADMQHILIITDEGAGFDWNAYTNPETALFTKLNGRGIAHARRYSFDEVLYNATGNSVAVSVKG